jgi:oligosaccharide repeat unit polymerase
VGVVWYAWNVATTLGWEAFREGPRIREALATYQIPSAFLFLQFFCIATPLLSAAVWLSGLRLRRIDVVLTALCVAGTWLSTDRTEFFTVVLGSLFMVLYARGPAWSVARTAGIGSIVLGGLAVNFLAINLWMRKQPEASAYVYLTASYPALKHALASPPAFTHGLHSVYPIARLLERLHLVRGPLPSPIFPFVPVTAGMPDHEWTFNGYTWLNYPYQDWGLGGVFAYVAVVGGAGGVLYGLLRRNRSRPIVLLLTAEMATGFLLSPFVDKFNNTASWYVAVATSVPFLAASRRRRARE